MRSTDIGKARLAEMIETATVDAYDDSGQATGWLTMFEDQLELPFKTKSLGVIVPVAGLDIRGCDQAVVICKRGRGRLTMVS